LFVVVTKIIHVVQKQSRKNCMVCELTSNRKLRKAALFELAMFCFSFIRSSFYVIFICKSDFFSVSRSQTDSSKCELLMC